MRRVKDETTTEAQPGDDGDLHHLVPPPVPVIRQRYRPTMFERLAILGGAELELTLGATGPALAVAQTE